MNSSPYPSRLVRRSLRIMWESRLPLGRMLLVPFFALIVWEVLAHLGWIPLGIATLLSLFLEALLAAYVGVRWIRWLLLGEEPPVGSDLLRIGPGGRVYVTLTLLFGSVATLVSLGLSFLLKPASVFLSLSTVPGLIVKSVISLAMILFPVFLRARFGFIWIDAALQEPIHLPEAWDRAEPVWGRLFRSLSLVVLTPVLMGGIVFYLLWLVSGESFQGVYGALNQWAASLFIVLLPLYSLLSTLLQLTIITAVYRRP